MSFQNYWRFRPKTAFVTRHSLATVFLSLFLVASCDTYPSDRDGVVFAQKLAAVSSAYATKADIQRLVQDTTIKFYDTSHGTQVEYFGSDGTAYLWYPGNTVVVPSRWYLETAESGATNMCFVYPTNSFNPVTQQAGGQPQCSNAYGFLIGGDEIVDSDIFDLRTRRIPFVLPKRRDLSLASLSQQLGRSPNLSNQAIWADLSN